MGEGALVSGGGSQLRCRDSVTPREQVVDPSNLVVGDATEDFGEPSLRVDAVEFGGFDQGEGSGGGLSTALRPGK